MIEQKVISYLAGDGTGLRVYAEVPVAPPEEFLIVERTSGGEGNEVRSATIAVQCISLYSLYNAAEISEWVIGQMREFTDSTENVFSCDLNSSYNYTNTTTKQYRYQAVFDISYQDDTQIE